MIPFQSFTFVRSIRQSRKNIEVMSTATAIAKKLIIEAKNVGRQEMAIRRTNSGIAGRIAEKVSNRRKWDAEYHYLSIDQSAAELASNLTEEELDYAKRVWA